MKQTYSLQLDTNAHAQTYWLLRCLIIYWFCLLTSIWVADGACLCVCVCVCSKCRAPLLLASIKRFLFYYVPCCRSCNKCCDQLLYNITIAAALAIATTTSESLDSNHEILVWRKKRTLSRSLGKRCLQMRTCMRVCVCVYEWTGIAFLLWLNLCETSRQVCSHFAPVRHCLLLPLPFTLWCGTQCAAGEIYALQHV